MSNYLEHKRDPFVSVSIIICNSNFHFNNNNEGQLDHAHLLRVLPVIEQFFISELRRKSI